MVPYRRKRSSSTAFQNFVVTSASEKALLEEQWARAFYSCRFSFSAAEDPEFQKAMELMRPGVGKNLLGRKDLAGRLLDAEHDKIDGNMRSRLEVIIKEKYLWVYP